MPIIGGHLPVIGVSVAHSRGVTVRAHYGDLSDLSDENGSVELRSG